MQDIVANVCFFIAQECHAVGQNEKAEFWYGQALRLEPENPELHYPMSYLAAQTDRFGQAIDHCTLAMNSEFETHAMIAHYNRALLKLMLNDYIGGFEDYDARLEFPLNKSSRIKRFGDLPYWKGEPCKTLHVSGEQGFGDIFQFSRYMPLIKDKFEVERIYFEVPRSLNELFTYNFRDNPEIEVVSEYWNPVADYHIQLVSLARLFKTEIGNIPPIKIEATKRDKFKFTNGFKIGYCYSGRAAHDDMQVMEWNKRRSVHGSYFRTIWEGLDVIAVPLQPELNQDIKDWSDTAEIINKMDLIISIDSGPVHLAAAMGVPVWLLNHKRTCWRWMLEGPHTPWYGTNVEIIRQKVDGEWESVIEEAKTKLSQLIELKKAA